LCEELLVIDIPTSAMYLNKPLVREYEHERHDYCLVECMHMSSCL